MLYLFSGDDSKRKILNYEKFIKSLPVQAGILPTETFFINRNDFDPIQIEDSKYRKQDCCQRREKRCISIVTIPLSNRSKTRGDTIEIS